VQLLRRYGYEVTRQDGSHIRMTSNAPGVDPHVSVPNHRAIKVGLLGDIVSEVAAHLGRDRDEFSEELFS
jgi:predicted RNA binding protein YcfA (HicA-like mRNA interferase family)